MIDPCDNAPQEIPVNQKNRSSTKVHSIRDKPRTIKSKNQRPASLPTTAPERQC